MNPGTFHQPARTVQRNSEQDTLTVCWVFPVLPLEPVTSCQTMNLQLTNPHQVPPSPKLHTDCATLLTRLLLIVFKILTNIFLQSYAIRRQVVRLTHTAMEVEEIDTIRWCRRRCL